GGFWAARGLLGARLLAFARALQQRIALELVLHVGGEVEIGQLQQLDRLHELRRHHERLALADQQLLRECHRVRRTWSVSCLYASHGAVHPVFRPELIESFPACPVLAPDIHLLAKTGERTAWTPGTSPVWARRNASHMRNSSPR